MSSAGSCVHMLVSVVCCVLVSGCGYVGYHKLTQSGYLPQKDTKGPAEQVQSRKKPKVTGRQIHAGEIMIFISHKVR